MEPRQSLGALAAVRWLAVALLVQQQPCEALAPQAFEARTGLRVLAHSAAVVVVDKPSGLRSTPAFLGGAPGSTRKARWVSAAASLETLPAVLREHARMLPRTRDKFCAFAVDRGGLGDVAAMRAWRALAYENALREAKEGVVETDSVLRRARRDGKVRGARSVHRLDASTSGILCLALDAESARFLSRQWSERTVGKTYEALVRGAVLDECGVIDVPLARTDADREGLTMMRPSASGKPCVTSYRVLERRADGTTRVELVPRTGRMHQLRAHMAQLGHPIVGDDIYGTGEAGRLCLHASKLSFVEPSGAPWHVESQVEWPYSSRGGCR